jgi:hypothetical protein
MDRVGKVNAELRVRLETLNRAYKLIDKRVAGFDHLESLLGI